MTISSRVVFTIILEASLSYFFGWLFGRSASAKKSLASFFFLIISSISAWVTVFNLEYFLIGKIPTQTNDYFLLFVLLIPAWLIGVFFLNRHVEEAVIAKEQDNAELRYHGFKDPVVFPRKKNRYPQRTVIKRPSRYYIKYQLSYEGVVFQTLGFMVIFIATCIR